MFEDQNEDQAQAIEVKKYTATARLRRTLEKRGKILQRASKRGDDSQYVIDAKTKMIEQRAPDVETLARELGVLKPWELLIS